MLDARVVLRHAAAHVGAVLDLGQDALVDGFTSASRSGSSTSLWFQKRATVPPGRSTRPILRQPRTGSIQCQASPQVIRSNVRPRSSQVSNAASSTVDAVLAGDPGHPLVELDAEHVQPARDQLGATLPVPQPTSSTFAGFRATSSSRNAGAGAGR